MTAWQRCGASRCAAAMACQAKRCLAVPHIANLSRNFADCVLGQGLWAASYGGHGEELLYCRLRGAGEPVEGLWEGPVPAVARLEALKVCGLVCMLWQVARMAQSVSPWTPSLLPSRPRRTACMHLPTITKVPCLPGRMRQCICSVWMRASGRQDPAEVYCVS